MQAAGRQSPSYYWLPDPAQNSPFFVSLQLYSFSGSKPAIIPKIRAKKKISQTCVQETSEQTRTRHERLWILPGSHFLLAEQGHYLRLRNHTNPRLFFFFFPLSSDPENKTTTAQHQK